MGKIQYTIRNIPEPVDQVIRKRAASSGKSFNQTVIDLLSLQTFGTIEPQPDDNFDWLFGSIVPKVCSDNRSITVWLNDLPELAARLRIT